jgi:hypothetical protein
MCFDQPYSVDFDVNHPGWFPNALDLALVHNALSVFQMGIGLCWFRWTKVPLLIMGIIMAFVQFGVAALSQIPNIPAKLVVLFVVSYGLLIYGVISFRSLDPEAPNEDKIGRDHKE